MGNEELGTPRSSFLIPNFSPPPLVFVRVVRGKFLPRQNCDQPQARQSRKLRDLRGFALLRQAGKSRKVRQTATAIAGNRPAFRQGVVYPVEPWGLSRDLPGCMGEQQSCLQDCDQPGCMASSNPVSRIATSRDAWRAASRRDATSPRNFRGNFCPASTEIA
jgi:hypothetical protein